MNQHPSPIKNLIERISRLPGLGAKSAERIVFYLLKQNEKYTAELIGDIASLKKNIKTCGRCFSLSADNPCPICADAKRDNSLICVVSEPQDIIIIEKTNDFRGRYHVLGGALNPVENVTPDKLKIKELISRIKSNGVKEIIIATNPDMEGETTAMYLVRQIKPLGVKITRLAKGLPIGASIEYADEITMSNALKGRQEI